MIPASVLVVEAERGPCWQTSARLPSCLIEFPQMPAVSQLSPDGGTRLFEVSVTRVRSAGWWQHEMVFGTELERRNRFLLFSKEEVLKCADRTCVRSSLCVRPEGAAGDCCSRGAGSPWTSA